MSTDISVGTRSRSPRHGWVRASWRLWLGLVALVPAVVGVATFMALFSISVQLTKAVVFQANVLTTVYLSLPEISTVSSTIALAIGLVALLGSRKALEAAALGLGVALVLFFGLMFVVAQAVIMQLPSGPDSFGAIRAVSVAFNPTPPAIAMIGPAVGTTLFLVRVRGFGERRPAIGALILGGLVSAYWLFSWLVFTLGSGD